MAGNQPTVGGSAVADGLEVFIEAKERVAVSTNQSSGPGIPIEFLTVFIGTHLRSWDMTLVAVPIEVEVPAMLRRQPSRPNGQSGGADLVEFRIDVLVEHAEGVTAARRLVQESPLPVLLTCRSDAEGGGRGERPMGFVSRSGGHGRSGPQFLDFEAAWSRSSNIRQSAVGGEPSAAGRRTAVGAEQT